MPFEIRVPIMGESLFEATVGRWLRKEGDAVAAGDTVLELETDKVNVEVTAGAAGRLERIVRQTGETVKPGDVLALIGGAVAASPAGVAATPASGPAASAPSAADLPSRAQADATPVARKLAQTHAVDLAGVHGTGPGGRVTKEDVEARVARLAPAAGDPAQPTGQSSSPSGQQATPPPIGGRPAAAGQPHPAGGAVREQRVRLSRRRLTIAQRLAEVNREAVMTTTFNEVDMTGIAELRRRYREEFKERHGADLGLMSFFVKATVAGLQAFPVLNAEVQGEDLVYKRFYDIGIAVAAEEGLLVPVVRDADRKSFAEIERDLAALAQKARDRKLTLDELRGGTFTITNGGVFGSLMSTPILNPPQVAILGMHRILERPVNVGGQVAIRPMMYLAVTYDHRVVDGADAVRFLVRVKQLLEDPGRLLVHA